MCLIDDVLIAALSATMFAIEDIAYGQGKDCNESEISNVRHGEIFDPG